MTQLEPLVIGAAILGTLFVLTAFLARGREIGWELSGATAFALYVRIASLAATVVAAIGLAELLRGWLVTAPLPSGFSPVRSSVPTEQLVRGATLLASGALFWLVHFLLPRHRVPASEELYLSFVAVAAVAFGVATVALLPSGVVPELQRLAGYQAAFRAEGTLGGGIAAFVFWIGHLWQLRAHLGTGPRYERLRPAGAALAEH